MTIVDRVHGNALKGARIEEKRSGNAPLAVVKIVGEQLAIDDIIALSDAPLHQVLISLLGERFPLGAEHSLDLRFRAQEPLRYAGAYMILRDKIGKQCIFT